MPYYLVGDVTVGLYAKKAGAWVKSGEATIYVNETVGGGGIQTVAFGGVADVNMGPGVEAFGVAIERVNGTSAEMTDLTSVSWTAIASSGERSATPNGQLSTVVVSPG